MWDRDPFLLGTPCGTLDLRTGQLQQGKPDDGITKVVAVAPAEAADCPLWLRFLHEATGEDKELIRFLQMLAGYALTGIDQRAHPRLHLRTGRQRQVRLHEHPHADHKSVRARRRHGDFLSHRETRDIPPSSRCYAVRDWSPLPETERVEFWAEGGSKELTAGTPITARFMRQDNFTYRLSSNY